MSKSGVPVSGFWVVIAQRPTSPRILIMASPIWSWLLDPAVLLVWLAAVELEEHPEAAAVHRLALLAFPAELGERCGRDQRHVAASAVDREPGRRLDEAKRLPGPPGERR